jgi:hypothetical protein
MPSFTTFPRNQSKWKRSDWSRPLLKEKDDHKTTPPPPTIQKPETKKSEFQPQRFSVFGNSKSKIAMINNSKEDEEVLVEKKEGQAEKKKNVKFDPIFLERVCLFNESQSPFELKGIHDKVSHLRIICSNWTSQKQHIRLDKKCFSVTKDNQGIKGQLMVRNLALDKSVSIRYTLDRWSTVREVDGVFFGPNPKNVTFDIYEFTMDLGHGQLADRGEMRGKIEFTIRVTAGIRDYYEDNNGHNYAIKVIADPLNRIKGDDEIDDEDEYPTEEEEEEKEKHASFTNALKGYQHAKPLHLKKRQQLFLGTRYNFSQSLSLSKKSSSIEPNYFPKPFIKPSSPPSDHVHLLDNMYIPTNTTPPTSPQCSPIIPSKLLSSSMDINSSYYLELLNKSCFYNSNSNDEA